MRLLGVAYRLDWIGLFANNHFNQIRRPISIQPYTSFEYNFPACFAIIVAGKKFIRVMSVDVEIHAPDPDGARRR